MSFCGKDSWIAPVERSNDDAAAAVIRRLASSLAKLSKGRLGWRAILQAPKRLTAEQPEHRLTRLVGESAALPLISEIS